MNRKTRVASPIALTFALTSVITLGLGGGVALADEIADLQVPEAQAGEAVLGETSDETATSVSAPTPDGDANGQPALVPGDGVTGDFVSASGEVATPGPEVPSPEGEGAELEDAVGDAGPDGPGEKIAGSESDKAAADDADVSHVGESNMTSDAIVADSALLSSTASAAAGGASVAPTFSVGWNRGDDGRWYWYDEGATESSRGWLVTDQSIDGSDSGLQRYWLDPLTGSLVMGKLVCVDSAGDYWAYATDRGYVVRGAHRVERGGKTYIYLADNDGRLEGTGWVVTGDYAGGALQRYYVDPKTHAVVVGLSSETGVSHTADYYDHYTTGEGYVLRGGKELSGKKYFADNDGRLTVGNWVVTDAFTGGLERYWATSDGSFLTGNFVTGAEYRAYAKDDGTILRGGATIDGERYWANNDGRITVSGWVVTADFTSGALQRYWADGDGSFFNEGLFDTGEGYYAYVGEDTTILRSKLLFTDKNGDRYVYIADNDGKLAGGLEGGWVVSDLYGDGLQRYWIDSSRHAAKIGFFEAEIDGQHYFGTDAGYVLRGTKRFELSSSGKFVQVADNEGKLIEYFVSGAGWQVTGAMTEGALQRYYLVNFDGHLYAEVDLFEADQNGKKSLFYGNEATGHVSRNERISVNGKTYVSDNDGRLIVATVRVYLDSGHGASGGAGFDPGASGSGYQEYRLTEELVSMVANIVRNKYGLDVVTHGDTNYSDRQDEAEANECDFLVSIHFNSFNGSATGSESYIHSLHAAPGSAELQDIMHKHLINGTGLYDRGQKQEQFAVVGGDVPAVLLEICFIDNSSDMAKYQARKQQIAEQLAAGIWEYAQRIS